VALAGERASLISTTPCYIPPSLADALRGASIDTATVAELGLAGRSDADVLVAAASDERALLTETPRISLASAPSGFRAAATTRGC
jgi:hypothetical protein